MTKLGDPTPGIKPHSIYPFFDVVQVRFASPLSDEAIRRLKRHCGGGVVDWTEKFWFNPDYPQCLRLFQPSPAAFAMLVRRDVLINYVEVSLDWIFATAEEAERARRFVDRHWAMTHYRQDDDRHVHVHEGTRYTAPQASPRDFVVYHDKESKLTGEVDCCHLEVRFQSRQSCSRLGIETFDDLLAFDHRQFWTRNLRFLEIDPVKLGRQHRKKRLGHRRTTRWVVKTRTGFEYDVDRAIGNAIIRGGYDQWDEYDERAGNRQQLVAYLRDQRFDVDRIVSRILPSDEVMALLPTQNAGEMQAG